MSTVDSPGEQTPAQTAQLGPLPVYLDVRAVFADRFLFGEGLEIGPLHQPLAIPAHARVRYVDRMTTPDLRHEYPELVDWDLTEVDIVDDGERLATIPAASQDFIVANHFLEHTEDPIGTIETHLAKLKPGGVLFYAVPDKRFTFDFRRPLTPIEHMVADHEEGPERSRAEHYREWCRLVIDEESDSVGSADQATSEEWVERRARELEDAKYSIHMHVWTQAEFLKLILALRERSGGAFDIEAAARVGIEFIVILRKEGPLPPPPPATEQTQATPLGADLARWRYRARRALSAVRREVRRRRGRP
jgi:SAM-dependent methyltransferase